MTEREPDALFELPESAQPVNRRQPGPAPKPATKPTNRIIAGIPPTAGFEPVPTSVAASVAAAGWTGSILPQINIGDCRVYPVIDPNPVVWQGRIDTGDGPELNLSTLAIWESWTADLGPMPPAPPLTIVGVASDARPGIARAAVSWLGGLGAGLVVATSIRRPRQQTTWECDYAGVNLVWAPHGQAATVMVAGRKGPVETARRSTLTRGVEERLFAWALHTNTSVI